MWCPPPLPAPSCYVPCTPCVEPLTPEQEEDFYGWFNSPAPPSRAGTFPDVSVTPHYLIPPPPAINCGATANQVCGGLWDTENTHTTVVHVETCCPPPKQPPMEMVPEPSGWIVWGGMLGIAVLWTIVISCFIRIFCELNKRK